MLGDHLIQFLIEPLQVAEARFKYYTLRRNLTRLEVLGLLRQRIGFFAISNLFDKVEMKDAETEVTEQIQERHGYRLQQLEKTIERMHNRLDTIKQEQ